MTSGNASGAPVAIDNAEALTALVGIADGFLLHDRAIHARSDDSVLRIDALGAATLRRSRGYVPDVLPLAADGATVLATGSYLKNAPALLYGNAALPGAHVGDLAHPAACVALEHAIAALQLHAGHAPQAIACDNGEHFASQLAAQLAATAKVPLLRVGHHHAHIGAVCAEHQLHGPVLGLTLDGHGVGDDGGAWGGELLRVDGARSQRIGNLAPLALPGGDTAAREPWRVAAAWLLQHGHADEAERRFGHQPAWPLLQQQLARGINTPYSSSMGRYFDLVGRTGRREPAARLRRRSAAAAASAGAALRAAGRGLAYRCGQRVAAGAAATAAAGPARRRHHRQPVARHAGGGAGQLGAGLPRNTTTSARWHWAGAVLPTAPCWPPCYRDYNRPDWPCTTRRPCRPATAVWPWARPG